MKIVEEINRMAELYPNLIAIKSDKDKPRIIATKNIRIELKQMFPDTKFSIKSRTFANGDSIHVAWQNGPQVEQVRKIIDKYQYGTFDGRDDSYTHNLSLFNDLFGGSKYVSGRRRGLL